MKSFYEIYQSFKALENARLIDFQADTGDGVFGGAGMVRIKTIPLMLIFASDLGWDHVSVSCKKRTPKYQEMKAVKRLMFKPSETAIEYHPPESDYISINDNVLHLWRPHALEIPMPPKLLV